MAAIQKFEDLECWKEGFTLSISIFRTFDSLKNYAFKDQICRASISITNNIAEGFERGSNKDFRKFLFIAKASCGEVRSMLYLAEALNFIDNDNFNNLKQKSEKCSSIISGLIKYLSNKIDNG